MRRRSSAGCLIVVGGGGRRTGIVVAGSIGTRTSSTANDLKSLCEEEWAAARESISCV